MSNKFTDIKKNIQAYLFYLNNKKLGITRSFASCLYNNYSKNINIINIIKSSKNIEDLKQKTQNNYELISKDLFLGNFIDGIQNGIFQGVFQLLYSSKLCKIYMDNDYKQEDTEKMLNEYKDIILEYILSNNTIKNSIQRGEGVANDFTKEITLEMLEEIFKLLFVDPSNLCQKDIQNIITIKKIIFKMQCIYPKEIIKNNKEFVRFEMLNGVLDEIFSELYNNIKKENISAPSVEERIKYYNERKTLSPDQNIKLNNIDLLEQRINRINHSNKEELIEIISQIKTEKDIQKRVELLEDCHLLYEITFREEIVDSLFTPKTSIEITDVEQLQNCLIHRFNYRSGNLLSGYDEKLKLKIINESTEKNPNRELTKEEQEKFDRQMEYAKNVLANKVIVEETIENNLLYSDNSGFRQYKADTSNQISTSLITPENIFDLNGFIGIGFDKTTLSPMNIAISSSKYKTTNMGIENLEIKLEHQFKQLSAPLFELEGQKETEIVLFRKGMDSFTKTAYIFVAVYTTTEEKDIIKIEEARKLAEDNNIKLVIFNLGKIKQSLSKYESEQELEENMHRNK